MFVACSLVAAAFLLAFIAMLLQDQPANIAFICFISSLLAIGFSVLLALDVRRESKTMKVVVTMKHGLPVDVISADIEEVNIANFKKSIDRKRLSNRELTAHIIHYYEQRKVLDAIKPDTELQIKFKEAPDAPVVVEEDEEEAIEEEAEAVHN